MSNADDTPKNDTALCKEIKARFNLPELKDLCHKLGIDYEDISSANANKSEKTQEFIDYLVRRGLEQELLDALRELRPKIQWGVYFPSLLDMPPIPTPEQRPPSLDKETGTEAFKQAVLRGDQFFQLKQYGLAIEAYTTALDLDHKAAGVYLKRGEAYEENQETQWALADYSQAIRLDPNWFTYWQRGYLNDQKNRSNEAIEDYGCALKCKPQPPSEWMFLLHYLRGHHCRKQGLYQEAINDYTEVIKLEPGSYLPLKGPLIYFKRGECYENLEMYEEAIQDYKNIIDLGRKDDSYKWACYHLVWIYEKMNRNKEAMVCIEQYISLTDNSDEKIQWNRDLERIKNKEKQEMG